MSYWQGKVVVITGGSAGLGKALSRAVAGAGGHVMLAARDPERLEQAVNELRQAGFTASRFAADVTQRAETDALVAATIDHYGRLDCLINNVGKSTRGNAIDTSADEFRELLELNFLSVVNCTQSAMPHLRESQGHLVNIGSLASKSVSRFLGGYPSTKFALAGYTHQLRCELGPEGIHVLLVCPGPITRGDEGKRYDEQSADLPATAKQPGGGVRLKGIDPNWLAKRILRACEKRQPELIVPAKARWLFAVSQLWPSLGDRIIQRMSN
jgi:short-subunit dehydrogenase